MLRHSLQRCFSYNGLIGTPISLKSNGLDFTGKKTWLLYPHLDILSNIKTKTTHTCYHYLFSRCKYREMKAIGDFWRQKIVCELGSDEMLWTNLYSLFVVSVCVPSSIFFFFCFSIMLSEITFIFCSLIIEFKTGKNTATAITWWYLNIDLDAED